MLSITWAAASLVMWRSDRDAQLRVDHHSGEALDRWLDQVYDDFTHQAANDRGVAHAELEPLPVPGRRPDGSSYA